MVGDGGLEGLDVGQGADFDIEALDGLLSGGGGHAGAQDYWPTQSDMGSVRRYEQARANDRIFDRSGLLELVDAASARGLRPLAPVGEGDLDAREQLVHSIRLQIHLCNPEIPLRTGQG
jgi:hypothetical protein